MKSLLFLAAACRTETGGRPVTFVCSVVNTAQTISVHMNPENYCLHNCLRDRRRLCVFLCVWVSNLSSKETQSASMSMCVFAFAAIAVQYYNLQS